MASTNKTKHYKLSQFVPLDKPAWLGDYNSDMQKIDAGIYAAQSKADSLGTEVETASTAATAAQQAAQSATEAAQQASEKAQDAKTTANGVAATASQALTTAQQAQTTAQQAQTAAQQAQTAASGALQTSGGTMTGPLVLNADPTNNLQAATKQYVDNKTGDVSFEGFNINATELNGFQNGNISGQITGNLIEFSLLLLFNSGTIANKSASFVNNIFEKLPYFNKYFTFPVGNISAGWYGVTLTIKHEANSNKITISTPAMTSDTLDTTPTGYTAVIIKF